MRRRCLAAAFLALFVGSVGASVAQTTPAAPAPGTRDTSAPLMMAPRSGGTPASSASCNFVLEHAPQLLRGLTESIPAGARQAAESRASNTGGAATAQAWHDVAVVLYLRGNMRLAAWAALTAAADGWQEAFVADAGTILLGLGRNEEGVQFLRCGYETGDRSPYLLEALAAGYVRLGKRGEAREIIDEIDNDALEDPIVEIEKSFLDTGKPPPPAPPSADEMQRCIALVDQHMAQIIAATRTRDRRLDQLWQTPNLHDRIITAFVQSRERLGAMLRTMNARPAATPEEFDSRLIQCMATYYSFTLMRLDTDVFEIGGFDAFFWARVLATTPQAFADDTFHHGAIGERGINSVADTKRHDDDYKAAEAEETKDFTACSHIQHNEDCFKTAKINFCHAWQRIHDQFADAEDRRYNTAAHRFDPAATAFAWAIEAELADARGFIARELKKLKPASQQYLQSAMKGLTDSFNRVQTTERKKAERALNDNASFFLSGQRGLRQYLEQEQHSIDVQCVPVLAPPNLDDLAQDEWQKVLAHFTSDYDAKLDCTGEIDSAKFEWKEGDDSVQGKWKNIKAKFDLSSGKLSVTGSWKFEGDPGGQEGSDASPDAGKLGGEVNAGVETKNGKLVAVSVGGSVTQSGPGGSTTVSVETKNDTVAVGGSVSQDGPLGTITANGKITLLSDTNPNTGVNQPAVAVSGSVGLGAKGEIGGTKVGVNCTPGTGSAKVYPRGLVQDAINYLLAAGKP